MKFNPSSPFITSRPLPNAGGGRRPTALFGVANSRVTEPHPSPISPQKASSENSESHSTPKKRVADTSSSSVRYSSPPSSRFVMGTPPQSPKIQRVETPVQTMQKVNIASQNTNAATREHTIVLENNHHITFENDEFTTDRSLKQVLPVKYFDGSHTHAAIAIITTNKKTTPFQPDAMHALIGLRATVDLGEKTIQIFDRGVTLFQARQWVVGAYSENPGNLTNGILACIDGVSQALRVIEQIHSLRYAHMDLKSSNIIFNGSGGATLIDISTPPGFGNSTGFDFDEGYASPTRPHRASSESDVYSIGKTIQFLATKLPNGDLKSELTDLCRRVSQKEKADRPSISAVIEEIEALLTRHDPENHRQVIKREIMRAHDANLNPGNPDFYQQEDSSIQHWEE